MQIIPKADNSISKKTKLLSFLIIFTPLAEPYSLVGISLDTVLFLIIILLSLLWNAKRLYNTFGFSAFLIYALIIPNICAISAGYTNHLISSLIVVCMYAACIYFTFSSVDLKYMLRIYSILVLIICLFFVTQELMFLLLGYRVSGLLPFLPIKYEGMDMSSFINYQMTYERSSSFFLEPSHMAQYILPALAISLGRIKNVFSLSKYLIPFIITAIILLSRSGCGVVGAIFIWGFFVLFVNIGTLKKVLFISFACIVSIYAFDKIVTTEYGIHMINRTSEFDTNASYERSGIIRVIRGFLVYEDMDLSEKILGVGTGGSIDVIDNNKYKFMFFGEERYLNNVQMLLIGFGILGAFIFLVHLIRLSKKNCLESKLIMIAFIALSFLESFFMNSKMVLYMSFIFAYKLNYSLQKHIQDNAKTIKC